MQGGGQTTDKKRTVHCQEIWGVEQMGRVLGESRTSALGVLDIEGNRPLPERENKKGHFRSSVCVCVTHYDQFFFLGMLSTGRFGRIKEVIATE